jgi:hypothetical protein
MTSINQLNDYRDMAAERLQLLKSQDPKTFSAQKMAKHMRIHPPFLSAVLRKKLHFNSDQVFLCGNYLELSPNEQALLECMFEMNRTTSKMRREKLSIQIDRIRKRLSKTTEVISHQKPDPSSADWFEYFADARFQMLHMALSIDQNQSNPALIQSRLQLTDEEFRYALKLLQKLELIERTDTGFRILKDMLHLPDNHRAIAYFQNSARIAALKLNRKEEDTKFSVFFTATPETAAEIRRQFNLFLKTIQPLVRDAKSKNLFQINFDLLSWL